MARILIVEDDADIASLLQRGLGVAGFDTHWAETGEATAEALAAGAFDAAIIDMMLGTESGADLLADLRARGHRMPAIMLSALARVEDRAEGLEAGAQDYVVKPFQLGELIARLEVQLHRASPRREVLKMGALAYDPETRMVTGTGPAAGRGIPLTEREGELMAHFLRHRGEVLSRAGIFDALWARHGGSTENVVDVYLGYLRRKLDNFTGYGLSLRTLRGRGFMLVLEETE